jgi:GcrA cell cycle regulator
MSQPHRTDLWPPEREQRLIELVAIERRVVDIATKLGCTKSAVIGKVHRLQAKGVLRETRWLWSQNRKEAEARWPKRYYAPRPRTPPPDREQPLPEPKLSAVTKPVPVPDVDLAQRPPNPWTPRTLAAMPMRRLKLMQLRDGCCRWPIGEPKTRGFCFCGNDAKPGRPYCEPHYAFAHGGG